METRESLGYLKGLIEGLDVKDSKEAKIYDAIIDVLSNIAEDIDDMTEGMELLADQVDDIDADLADVEDYLEDEDDCDCDCDCEDEEYEVECPVCHESFVIDEDTAMEGKFACPNCGEHLEFEFDDDCDCDCCCED